MRENPDTLHWPMLARAYGEAERGLGRLAHAFETTRLHQTWLWRETTRVSAALVQAGGYRADADRLRLALIGAPIEPDDNTSGLAAAKRVFLTAAALFRESRKTDSKSQIWPEFWHGGGEAPPDRAGQGDDDRQRLLGLVRELAGFADDGRRPALINLFIDLRRHARARQMPPHLLRLALPLALVESRLVPKPAPGLLGGRRLALGMSPASPEAKPLSDWLKTGLDSLAEEARQSQERLLELTRQHQAWHGALAGAGLRRHARTPVALDLLAATPVLSIGLVARHLGCSHVAAGRIVERLADLGILTGTTTRSRHKIFIAGDLPAPARDEIGIDGPLAFSTPAPALDIDALGATLDGLLADLERAMAKTRTTRPFP